MGTIRTGAHGPFATQGINPPSRTKVHSPSRPVPARDLPNRRSAPDSPMSDGATRDHDHPDTPMHEQSLRGHRRDRNRPSQLPHMSSSTVAHVREQSLRGRAPTTHATTASSHAPRWLGQCPQRAASDTQRCRRDASFPPRHRERSPRAACQGSPTWSCSPR